jgi:hypothetical protein
MQSRLDGLLFLWYALLYGGGKMKHFGDTSSKMVDIAFELDHIINNGEQNGADIVVNGKRTIPDYKFSSETIEKITKAKYTIYRANCMINCIDDLLSGCSEGEFAKAWDELYLSGGSSC